MRSKFSLSFSVQYHLYFTLLMHEKMVKMKVMLPSKCLCFSVEEWLKFQDWVLIWGCNV